MITVKNTGNYAGVCISGDFDDLNKLVDAFHEITVDEFSEKNRRYIGISTRVLGVCYDVRHAMQGDREVELVDNGMNEDKMKFHSIIAPINNVYYSCNILYPEMFFVMLALNELVKVRIRELAKVKYIYPGIPFEDVIWDDKIATIRSFQAEFMNCVKETLAENTFKRWLNLMNKEDIFIECIMGQYVDLQNLKYLDMTKEKRLKNMSITAKRIVEYSDEPQHIEIEEIVTKAAREYQCSEEEIRLNGMEYTEKIIW